MPGMRLLLLRRAWDGACAIEGGRVECWRRGGYGGGGGGGRAEGEDVACVGLVVVFVFFVDIVVIGILGIAVVVEGRCGARVCSGGAGGRGPACAGRRAERHGGGKRVGREEDEGRDGLRDGPGSDHLALFPPGTSPYLTPIYGISPNSNVPLFLPSRPDILPLPPTSSRPIFQAVPSMGIRPPSPPFAIDDALASLHLAHDPIDVAIL